MKNLFKAIALEAAYRSDVYESGEDEEFFTKPDWIDDDRFGGGKVLKNLAAGKHPGSE